MQGCMPALARISILLLAVLPLARGAERDVTKTFPVQPGCVLTVDTYRGRITVEESDAREVVVAIHMETGVGSEIRSVPAPRLSLSEIFGLAFLRLPLLALPVQNL